MSSVERFQADERRDAAPRHERSLRGEVTEEMMACPTPRVPFVTPGTEAENVTPIYDRCRKIWGTVPRYIQLLAHVPAAAEAWVLTDTEIRYKRRHDRERVRLQQLAIIKTSLMNQCNN